MLDVVLCPRCQRRLTFQDQLRGQEVQCPSCKFCFLVEPPPPDRPAPQDAIPYALEPEEQLPRPRWGEDDYGVDAPPRRARPRRKTYETPWLVILISLALPAGCVVLFILSALNDQRNKSQQP